MIEIALLSNINNMNIWVQVGLKTMNNNILNEFYNQRLTCINYHLYIMVILNMEMLHTHVIKERDVCV